ncbi:efflux transporter, RND family, MFP subunit [Plesiocystis pacifica SIR-1]|uniref:Efflux transporter, RND family, MFP subunit n=1 Tax=Plesiocystis pacifica SIR-1 TaxID=391625 RepID=A6GEM8_9BACT|nr:hypothetical protein [Plesiocystis pacifica]EDM75674.1 efflux transporter, RND family, MFP subunit [Plesiocystis pacifica SIR-1]
MQRSDSPLIRATTLAGLTALGVGLYLWLSQTQQRPRTESKRDRGQSVRVIEVRETEAVPRVTGYGEVAAARSWEGVAAVGGTIVGMDPNLQVGRLMRAGTLLFEIDPEELELEKRRTQASAKAVKAQIHEIEVREKSTKASLEIEEKALALVNRDLERTQLLYRQGSASLSEVEAAESAVLSAEKSVLALNNTLAELPAERRILAAQLEEVNAGVTGAELELTRTKIVAPFTMRVTELHVTTGQTVSGSQVLVVGEGLDTLEVTARLPIGGIDPLLPARPEPPPRPLEDRALAGRDSPAEDRSLGDEPQPPPSPADGVEGTGPVTSGQTRGAQGRRRGGWISSIAEHVHPTVHLRTAGIEASWPARFGRFAGVDSQTRTSGVVVEIDHELRRSGSRHVHLSSGMHVSVEFIGEPKPGCLALPTEAVHEGRVYVVDEDDRLEIREVEIGWSQESFVCVAEGIAVGERVTVSEVAPAVDGMRVAPRVDAFESSRLAELVAGPAPSSGERAASNPGEAQ